MKKLACVLLLLCAVHPALAEEPIKFRGAWIGESVSDYVNCSSAKGKSLREGYKVHGKPCSDKGSVFRTKAKGFMSSKLQGEGFLFQDGKLFRITIYIPNEDWDKVRYDLTEKLGPPAKEVPQVFQNAFGARYEYEQGFWQKGDIVAFGKIKVATLGNEAIKNPFTNLPDTEGIEVTITDAEHAKLPDTLPSTMD